MVTPILRLVFCACLLSMYSGISERDVNEAICSIDACYTVHLSNETFIDARKDCAKQKGDLVTIENEEEAEHVYSLLWKFTNTTPITHPLKLWIGLQLKLKSCVKRYQALRGFSWITDTHYAKEGNFSNWLTEPMGTCVREKCVSMKFQMDSPDNYKWTDEPCSLQADGYICKFKGNLSPEFGGTGFGSYGQSFLYTPAQGKIALRRRVLWRTENELQSNIAASMQPAGKERVNQTPENSAHMTQNQSRQIQGMCQPVVLAGPGYVEYDTPFSIKSSSLDLVPPGSLASVSCGHIGKHTSPSIACWKSDETHELGCKYNNGGCEHECVEYPQNKSISCRCSNGYMLAPDSVSCIYADHCQSNPCEQGCINHQNGFTCLCSSGFALAENHINCNDIKGCLHGECDPSVINDHKNEDLESKFYTTSSIQRKDEPHRTTPHPNIDIENNKEDPQKITRSTLMPSVGIAYTSDSPK
ncbi:unnamed protein product [Ranitomeya imitator]|uniref:C-type lectin domain-containing protein n=1 Tax=Ranitomeya imitator TaxID=111125 RepID=A0ABN9L9Y5_9NEOB|nr:unnamed protein product [Ranitomeya imitator]